MVNLWPLDNDRWAQHIPIYTDLRPVIYWSKTIHWPQEIHYWSHTYLKGWSHEGGGEGGSPPSNNLSKLVEKFILYTLALKLRWSKKNSFVYSYFINFMVKNTKVCFKWPKSEQKSTKKVWKVTNGSKLAKKNSKLI